MEIAQKPLLGLILNPFGATARSLTLDSDAITAKGARMRDQMDTEEEVCTATM